MDPFEVRLSFLTYLRRLNASQQSIQKAVGYAIKYFSSCGEDLWDCIVEECQKGSINSRINILYFLDSLCETCLLVKSHASSTSSSSSNSKAESNLYVAFVTRDLAKIVELVVPQGRQGLPNLVSTKQILENWRSKRVIDPQTIEDVLSSLSSCKIAASDSAPPPTTTAGLSTFDPTTAPLTNPTPASRHREKDKDALPRHEVFKRIEEDRERHKRLRERRWVQPITHTSHKPLQLACFMPLTSAGDGEEELAIDIEFENEWEETSDWNEDDEELAGEESELCFPAEGEGPMDLS